jgi:mono/diheme cytochrome c family protein
VKRNILALTGLILAGLVSVADPASAQQAAPAGNAENGKKIFMEVGCYECHGQAGQGGRMTGPAIARTKFEFEGFLNQLRHPANQMPPYEAPVVSDQEAADIYAYVEQMPVPRDPKSIPLLNAGR